MAFGQEILLRLLAGLNGCLVGRPLFVTLLCGLHVCRRGGSRWLRGGRCSGLRRWRGRSRSLPAAFGNEGFLRLSARLNGCLIGRPFIIALLGRFLLSRSRK